MRKLVITFCLLLVCSGAYAFDLTLKEPRSVSISAPKVAHSRPSLTPSGKFGRAVYVQAYSFTSAPIAKALVDAARRGVKVEVILDKSQRKETYTGATFLRNEGVPVYIDAAHAIAHNKVMVIDGQTVVTGSFNFTKAAQEKNGENLLIIRDAGLAKLYMENWEQHRQHSEEY
ncbi:phospholipase D family protein [Solidesulfovibrio sp.]|uniref:phospholipase D family nuclease n=1 Tax=Solidesulfovibrio sp. TaxID=2910990 RepID=UPI002626CD24|nr:phospholipase D family protein [Solidesulfovibrio sp.]